METSDCRLIYWKLHAVYVSDLLTLAFSLATLLDKWFVLYEL